MPTPSFERKGNPTTPMRKRLVGWSSKPKKTEKSLEDEATETTQSAVSVFITRHRRRRQQMRRRLHKHRKRPPNTSQPVGAVTVDAAYCGHPFCSLPDTTWNLETDLEPISGNHSLKSSTRTEVSFSGNRKDISVHNKQNIATSLNVSIPRFFSNQRTTAALINLSGSRIMDNKIFKIETLSLLSWSHPKSKTKPLLQKTVRWKLERRLRPR